MKKAISIILMMLLLILVMPAGSVFAAEKVVYLDGTNGKDTNSGADASNAVATLKKAMELLAENGGTIMVSGDTSVDPGGDEFPAYNGTNIVLPDYNGTIHIRGVKKSDGSYPKLIQTDASTFTTLGFKGNLIISDIVIKTTQNLMICMRGHNLTMGTNIQVETNPSISTTGVWIYGYSQSGADAGTKTSDYVYNQTINIYSGTYDLITGTGASGSMKLNGTDTNLQKVKGDIVINLYGGTVSGTNTKILSCENNGQVEGNVTVNIYKGVNFDYSKLSLNGQSSKISGKSTLNLYNFTTEEENTIKAKISSDSTFTDVKGGLTGTIPAFNPDSTTQPETTTAPSTSPTTSDFTVLVVMGITILLAVVLRMAGTLPRKARHQG